MSTTFNEVVTFAATSHIGASLAFGHKSTLDTLGVSYSGWSVTGSSASRIAATNHDNATKLGIALDTLIAELQAKGIIG